MPTPSAKSGTRKVAVEPTPRAIELGEQIWAAPTIRRLVYQNLFPTSRRSSRLNFINRMTLDKRSFPEAVAVRWASIDFWRYLRMWREIPSKVSATDVPTRNPSSHRDLCVAKAGFVYRSYPTSRYLKILTDTIPLCRFARSLRALPCFCLGRIWQYFHPKETRYAIRAYKHDDHD